MLGLRLLPFLKLLSLAFILYSVAASFSKMSAVFTRRIDPFPIFYGGEWDTCMFGVFTAGFSGERMQHSTPL